MRGTTAEEASMTDERTRAQLVRELTGPLQDAGYDLEAVEVSPAGRRRLLRVAVDKDRGVTMDEISEATKVISRLLDDSDVMGEQPYTLEVTSPGVDRPLTLPRHWRRNQGRLVAVHLDGGAQVTGRIRGTSEESVELEIGDGTRTVAFADVTKARVQVEFNRKES
jgi:ribosome maturation factor RimP